MVISYTDYNFIADNPYTKVDLNYELKAMALRDEIVKIRKIEFPKKTQRLFKSSITCF